MTWLPLGSSLSMLCSSATMNVVSPQPQISTSCSLQSEFSHTSQYKRMRAGNLQVCLTAELGRACSSERSPARQWQACIKGTARHARKSLYR